MSIIYMVRHGQASFGKPNYDELSERGILQARVLAEYLLQIDLTYDAVYSGEMIRQRDTAREVISVYRERGMPIPELRTAPEFNEYDSKSVFTSYMYELAAEDPVTREDLANIYTDRRAFERVFEKVVRRWISGNHDRPGLTTWDEFRERVQGGIRRVMEENGRKKKILIFTSGGPVSAALNMTLGISAEHAMRLAALVANAAITTFLYTEERISLASFNTVSHLVLRNGGELVTYR